MADDKMLGTEMMNKFVAAGLFAISGLVLTGCNEIDQSELLSKIKSVTSPEEIVASIGPANEMVSDGAMNLWRYETNRDDVCFMVAGKVAMRAKC